LLVYSLNTIPQRAEVVDAARLNAVSVYGPSRFPDYRDVDGDGMIDNWDGVAPGGAQVGRR
jgi:hypothetical protein